MVAVVAKVVDVVDDVEVGNVVDDVEVGNVVDDVEVGNVVDDVDFVFEVVGEKAPSDTPSGP